MRSKYKLSYIGKTLNSYLYGNNKNIKLNYYTKKRSIMLTPTIALKFNFLVYNGFNYYRLKLRNRSFGKKLGEFVFTRKIFKFKKKKKR